MAVTGSFGTGTSHVVVDVVGYITSTGAPASEAGLFVPVRPARAFDTRTGIGELTVAQEVVIDASDAPGVEIPSTATGVVWNFAALSVRQPGFGRAWAADAPKPATSSFNWSLVGETRAAAVITAVDSGRSRVVLDNGSGLPT